MRLRFREPQSRAGERGYVGVGELVYCGLLSDRASVEIKFGGLL